MRARIKPAAVGILLDSKQSEVLALRMRRLFIATVFILAAAVARAEIPTQAADRFADSIGVCTGVIAFQKDLYAAVKADAATRALTVIGPSLGKTYGYETRSPFGKGTLAEFVDWGNFHPYPGGNPFSVPSPYAGVEKYIWHGGQPSANMDEFPFAFDIYAPPFAPKPMAATETGYSTFSDGPSEAAHAKYLPRLFCEYFRKGVQRTFSYEFVDEWNKPDDRESNFGLIRHDLSPSPPFTRCAGSSR